MSEATIKRAELPAYERRGALAQEILGQRVTVAFHQARVDVEMVDGGFPAGLGNEFTGLRPGIADTVVLGSLSAGRDRVSLFDVAMIERRSRRGWPWRERLDLLEALWSRLPSEVKQVYPLARTWHRGLLAAFDEVNRTGGLGLLVRIAGDSKTLMCDKV